MLITLLRLSMSNKDSYVLHGRVLPINLSASPMAFLRALGFSQLVKPAFASLRMEGYTINSFIDDTLIGSKTYSGCIQATISLLQKLGFCINVE